VSISRQFACRTFRKGDIGQIWGGFYTEDRQFWQHQCMLGYTDFAPEASVDDDSTKMLSVDILLETTEHTLTLQLLGFEPLLHNISAHPNPQVTYSLE
jgi:hypothetical protein